VENPSPRNNANKDTTPRAGLRTRARTRKREGTRRRIGTWRTRECCRRHSRNNITH